jgi:ubiquinone/menaquinone biosynthesis C-methylase UbiE
MEWRYSTFVEPTYDLASSTGIFAALASGSTTVEQIAEKTHLSQRGVRCILRCLVGAGILSLKNDHYQQVAQELPGSFKHMVSAVYELRENIEKGLFEKVTADGMLPVETPQGLITLGIAERQGERLVLTEPGRAYFTRQQEFYLGTFVVQSLNTVKFLLQRLEEIVRTGQRVAVNDPKFFAGIIQTLFLMNYGVAQQLADYLSTKDGITTALDLGCGSAVWSIPLAHKNPNMSITAVDSALVLEKTRAYTERFGVSDQYRYQPVIDCTTEEDWGKDIYDIIYLGHLCEGLLPEHNQRLIANCARYLRPGGYLVIADFMPKEDWSGALLDVLFSIQMLCFTNSEGPYTQQAYEKWCCNVGLTEIEGVQLPGATAPVLVVQKPER